MQRPRGISSHFLFISSIRQPLPLHHFKGTIYTIPSISSNRRFNVNDNLNAHAVSGEGGNQRQHVSNDVALEMERRKNARLEGRMKDFMKALMGVDNGGASKNKMRAKAKEMPAIDKINYSAVYAKIDEDV